MTAAAQGFLAPQQQSRPDGKTLTAALLRAEKAAKQTRKSLPLDVLLGTWRLCFSAGKKAKLQSGQPVGNGFYMPKLAIARISFARNGDSEDSLQITNELQIGPLTVRFTGPARYPGKKNLLVFDFTYLQLQCFGLKVFSGKIGQRDDQSFVTTPVAKLPFFAFFTATADYIAARGRGGGLAIWVQE
ncbi:hypothetical protein DYY88_12155 [Leptolyngbya iicbica LK]|uniref:Plastid lipid-associated protein/fibrillin conserved domain-containing protein n=2 Tax=Cyanophyceae TaxID=3028117 RepID=A0A4Q7EBJ7_9CYAN|nr:hypothetical protein DYY88_12155 [Leptolyngbya sp. LK]